MCGCRFLCEGTVVQCWSRELWNRFVRIENKGKFSRSVSIWLQLGLNPKIAVNIVSNLNPGFYNCLIEENAVTSRDVIKAIAHKEAKSGFGKTPNEPVELILE